MAKKEKQDTRRIRFLKRRMDVDREFADMATARGYAVDWPRNGRRTATTPAAPQTATDPAQTVEPPEPEAENGGKPKKARRRASDPAASG